MTIDNPQVDVHALRAAIRGGAPCEVIDVREYPEFASGRVPGSRLIPLGDVDRRAAEIDRSKTVYLVCRTGRRSAEAQQRLRAAGFPDVRNVAGGVTEWKAAGYELDRDGRAPWALERQVRLVAGSIVLLGVLLSVFVAQPLVWLSACVGAGLMFSAVTDSCAMGLLLAKLPYNRVGPRSDAACPAERGAAGD